MLYSLWTPIFALLSTTLADPCKQPSTPDCEEPWLALDDLVDAAAQWQRYKLQFKKTYATDDEEFKRMELWRNNTLRIMKENSDSSNTYSAGWTDFTDMSQEEYQARLGYVPANDSTEAWGLSYLGEHRFNGQVSDLPTSWDWSLAGQSPGGISVVTQIKDQGQCGSCWSFSVTGALEGAHAVANGIDAGKISMSEQQLIDCSGSGCGGGSPSRAIDWEKMENVCQEQSYPYRGRGGWCHANGCTVILDKGAIWGHYSVQRTEGAHCSALMQRPLSVVVNAANGPFQNYRSGIMNNCPQGQTDHAILLVGWGYVYNNAYWKVKNSWGTRWGLSGFGLIQRGIGGMDGCAVLSGTNGAYVYGPYNPGSQIYDRQGKLVEADDKLNKLGTAPKNVVV